MNRLKSEKLVDNHRERKRLDGSSLLGEGDFATSSFVTKRC